MKDAGPILAVDPGSARIGLAISDADRMIALPLEVVPTARDGSHLRRIADVVGEREIHEIIVGLPRRLDGSEGPSAESARELAAQIAELTGASVALVDERLTTVAAERRLREAGVTKTRRMIDSVAAAQLLQSHLDGIAK